MGICLLYPYTFHAPPARAEPVVSACVLEKSLKMYRDIGDICPHAAVFWGE